MNGFRVRVGGAAVLLAGLAALLAGCNQAGSASTGTFGNASSYAAGSDSHWVAVGDFDGDGKLDLVVVNHKQSGTVSVLLGDGDGGFQAPQTYATDAYPYSVAVGDFDGDGTPDLVTDTDGGDLDVSVLLDNGDGTFGSASSFAAGGLPLAVAVGDFNGDGKPDIAVANSGDASVSVLLNSGDGTFGTAGRNPCQVGYWPVSVAVGDFDGDGTLDFAVANDTDNTVSVVLNNGDGTFPINAGPAYAVGNDPVSVAVGDFNGDGHPDLAVVDSGQSGPGSVSVLLNNGDGTFPTSGAPAYAVGNDPVSVAVGDFNGDGMPDLAVVNSGDNSVSELLNNGDGTFPTSGAPTYMVGSSPRSLAVGDFNGDGKLDLAIADDTTQGSVSVLLGQ